jgi:CRP-like cAMP-binding protein
MSNSESMAKSALIREMSQAKRSEHSAAPAETLSDLPIPLFAGLSPSQIAEVFAQARTLDVMPKAHLCNAGHRAGHLFVLLKGRIKYSRTTAEGGEILLHLLTPGESFGLATLLPDPPNYLGTAEVVSASEVVVWDHGQIRQIAGRHQQIATNALRIALDYLGKLADRHSSLFEGDAAHRIARVLIDVGRRSGGAHPQGIDVHITNEQLGSLADVSRFTASRVLSSWKRTGIITKKRETVRIHSPEALLSG